MSISKFGLISVPHDRFFIVSDDYESLKITQLVIMKHDLFYLADISLVKDSGPIDNKNAINFSLSSSSRLHLEPDVETRKLSRRRVVHRPAPTDVELRLKEKVEFVFNIVKTINSLHQLIVATLQDELNQETQGLLVTQKFFNDVLGEDLQLESVIDRDLREIQFPIHAVDESKQSLMKILSNVDYEQDLRSIKDQIKEKMNLVSFIGQGPMKLQKAALAYCK